MDFHVFKSKKKKPEPEESAPEPKAPAPAPPAPKPAPSPATPSASKPKPPPSNGGGAYMDELERMARVRGMRNFEVTTSRTFRFNFRDPVDGCDYEYYYQDQSPPMAHWGCMQRPPTRHMAQALSPRPRQLLGPPPPQYQYGPPGPLVASSHPYFDYGHIGAPSAYDSCYEDEYPSDCSVM